MLDFIHMLQQQLKFLCHSYFFLRQTSFLERSTLVLGAVTNNLETFLISNYTVLDSRMFL